MREQRDRQKGPAAGGDQPGLNQLLKSFNVFLELAGQELAGFGIQTLHVGRQRQQCAEHQDGQVNEQDGHGVFLLGRLSLYLRVATDLLLDGEATVTPGSLRWMSE